MSIEKEGKQFLINTKKGFHDLTPRLKKKIADKYRIGIGTFDLIKLPVQIKSLPLDNNDLSNNQLEKVILIEIKSSGRDIDKSLKGFFFGYTYSEQMTAQKLNNKYKIAFVVIPKSNKQKGFYKLVGSKELWSLVRHANLVWHISF